MQGVKDSFVLVSVGGIERDNFRAHFGILRHFSSVMLFGENGRVIVDIEDGNFQLHQRFQYNENIQLPSRPLASKCE